MPTNVVMPQMGESIAEGTIVRWIKKVGDKVERDEPLFEISTDKVDAEIPSPAGGVLAEIKVNEGETVPVDSVVAVIGQPGEGGAASPRPPTSEPAGQKSAPPEAAPQLPPTMPPKPSAPPTAAPEAQEEERRAAAPPPVAPSVSPPAPPRREPAGAETRPPASMPPSPPTKELSKEDLRRQRSSPLVRRIAAENEVDISQIQGTGIGGRVTKDDILAYLQQPRAAGAPAATAQPAPEPAAEAAVQTPAFKPGERFERVPMSVMRRKIAEHMVMSRRTSAHVHSVFEVDYTRVAKIRGAKKAEFERAGLKLTYLAFIARATVDALRALPVINASLDGENIIYKKDINLGIAVALDWGLIVPVIKNADEKNILGLSRAITDLAERARTKQLKPEDVQGGTFTITNPGVFGAAFGMPIINQPQVAILGVGAIEKRPVIVDDAIAIRMRGFLTLGYDHRLIDGAVADQFMSDVKKRIENFDPAAV